MPGLSKVIVLDPDARAGRQIQLGFQREGVPAELAEVPREGAEVVLPGEQPGLVVVGGADGRGLELVRQARKALDGGSIDAPIVFAGRGVRRTDAEAAGADEVVLAPAYLRDIVTIGRLLRGQPATHRAHLVGSLAETTGVLTLVRALSALGRSAMLTLIRGLRRGEIRFYHGEVTSAHVGMIHGQAALHQLLLWTDARFDFHHEDIVRRHQIPLERDELFADAERFLTGVRDSSGKLSPSMVLEQDVPRLQSLGKQIPTEVYGVLRMFDGHRVLADVLEDSPYRVFETLRVAQLALEAGLLRLATTARPRATWRAVLALEEWLVGAETREEVLERTAEGESEPGPRAVPEPAATRTVKAKGASRKRRRKRGRTPAPTPAPIAVAPAVKAADAGTAPGDAGAAAKPEIDWGLLVPRVVGAEVGPLAGVVPASHASGEIDLRSRGEREKLEALTDSGQRDRIFPAEVKTEPSVVWDEAAAKAEAAAAKAAAKAAAVEEKAVPEPATTEAETVRVERRAAQIPAMEGASGPASAMELVKQLVLEQDAGVYAPGAPTEPMAAVAPAESEPVAAEVVETELAVTVPIKVPPAAEPAPEPAATVVATPEPEPAPPAAIAAAPEPAPAPPEEPPAASAAAPEPEAVAPPEPEAVAPPEPEAVAPPEPASSAPPIAVPDVPVAAEPVPAEPARDAAPIVSSELAPTASGELHAAITATPLEIDDRSERPTAPMAVARPNRRASTELPPVIIELPPSEADRAAAPEEALDEPSDGIIRQPIASAETVPSGRRMPSAIPVDDRPEDATGEIVSKTGQQAAVEPPDIGEPSILVADLGPAASPDLVADLAAVHSAVSAVATAQAAAPPTPSMATAAQAQIVAAVRDDATAFSDVEEDFFRAGHEKPTRPPSHDETFADLDEGYRPVGFWDRLLGRKPKR